MSNMFDLPDAKRVRRRDLDRSGSCSPSSDTSQTEANAALLRSKLAAIYGPIEFDVPARSGVDADAKEEVRGHRKRKRGIRKGKSEDGDTGTGSDPASESEDSDSSKTRLCPLRQNQPEEQEYEFSLFRPPISTSAHAQTQHQTIILSLSDPTQGPGSILHPRPASHFIASKASGDKKAEWEYAAVSGEDVLKGRERRYWGLEVGWRVRVLTNVQRAPPPATSKSTASSKTQPPSRTDSKPEPQAPNADPLQDPNPTTHLSSAAPKPTKVKPKPNKRRRLLLRLLARAREAAEEARRKERESRDGAEKEKRTRRNRERKAKRKLKAKAKKLAGGGGVDGGKMGAGLVQERG